MSTDRTLGYGTNLDIVPLRENPEDSEDSENGDSQSDSSSEGSDSDGDEGSSEVDEGSSEVDEGSSEGDEGSDSDGDEGSDSDGDEGSSEGDEGSDSDGDDSGGDEEGSEGSDKNLPSRKAGSQAGEEKEISSELLEAMIRGITPQLLDNNNALKEALKEEMGEIEESLEDGELIWRPYDTGLDEIVVVPPGPPLAARNLLDSVSHEVSYLTAQLRTKFLQARSRKELHGVRKGQGLSERRIVNTVVEVRSGATPTRSEWREVLKPECSLAAAVVLDESGSMSSIVLHAARAGLAVASPLHNLGSPCMVVGTRYNTRYSSPDPSEISDGYHRYNGVTVDLFKDWHEPMSVALPRFARVRAEGGTPLEDGIQYAMQEINTRNERYRIIFAVTDGYPNNPAVVKHQIRIAAEAGVYIVGVGLQGGADAVGHLFPLNVRVTNLSQLPRQLMDVITRIMFPQRGREIALEGKIKPKTRR